MMRAHQFRAMNSEIVLMAEGYPLKTVEGFEAAESFIHTSEQRFTRFSEYSELAHLNHSSGSWFKASPDLFELIQEALVYFHKTGGLFDPTILPDLRRAGYDRSMDELRRISSSSSILSNSDPSPGGQSMSSLPSFDSIRLDADTSSILMPIGMQIDLGGLAKGWIAEHAAHLLSQCATACAVSAGGDMFLIGYPEGQDFWEVGLEDPRSPDHDLMILHVQAGALATSSVAKRIWQQGAVTRHHLIDPRTHAPAETDWLSVTVIAPRMAAAEAFAKASLIGGKEFAMQIAAQNRDLTILAVDKIGQLIDIQENEYVHH
jgi:thiamine biosynthesis lipoprotein